MMRLAFLPNDGAAAPSLESGADLVTIGRAEDCALVVHDEKASRHHCEVRRVPDGWRLQDLGSRNGTFINGVQVTSELLRPGDVIRVGTTEVQFDVLPARPEVPEEERLRQRVRDLEALLDVNKSLLSELNRERLLNVIVDAAVRLTGAERGFLIIFKGDRLLFESARHYRNEEIASPEFEVSRSIAREVGRTAKPVLTANALLDSRFEGNDSVAKLGLRSVLSVPLSLRDESIGAFYVDNRFEEGVFTVEQMELLQVFADQAALALVNANLFEENLRRTQELRVSHEEIERLNARLKVEMERQREELAQAQQALRERAREEGPFRYSYEGIVGRSEALRRLLHLLDRIIPTPLPVLVVGESGTGKELVARALHFNGPRAAGPFVSVNCGALPEALFESELFGFERGAFTGADRGREGVIQQASGGTLFLDEIGNLSLENQKKLLRVLQEGEVRRIGGQRTIKVDVRVISATNRNLEKAIETGEFRSDLYYRICGVKVAVPALRERREDVPLLVAWALDRLAREMEQPPRAVTPAVMRALVSYSWPGNVRELMNEMRRAWALSGGAEIGPEALSPHLLQEAAAPAREPGEAKPLKQQVADLEKQAILRALRLHSGNKSRVARVLGISRLGLKKKMDRYRLEEP